MILLELSVDHWDILLRLADRRWHELNAQRGFNTPDEEATEILAQQHDLEAVMAVLREAAR